MLSKQTHQGPNYPQNLYVSHVWDFGGVIFWFHMKTFLTIIAAVILSVAAACSPKADEFTDLFTRVENLNVQRHDYILGKVLTDKQKKTAQRNALEAASPGTYKFNDNDLYVVADQVSDRVLVIYERYEPASREKIRELVGALFFDLGDPTVLPMTRPSTGLLIRTVKFQRSNTATLKKKGNRRKSWQP